MQEARGKKKEARSFGAIEAAGSKWQIQLNLVNPINSINSINLINSINPINLLTYKPTNLYTNPTRPLNKLNLGKASRTLYVKQNTTTNILYIINI